jgi:ACR3 family arsenite efflux pump ArsB
MLNGLKWVKQNLTPLILVTIPVGLLAGKMFQLGFLKQTTTWILFLMIYPMMINLNMGDVLKVFRQPKTVLLSVIMNFTVAPLLAFALARLFLISDPMLMTGMMLIALIPTSGMTASWAGLAGGKLQTALVMIAVNLLLSIVFIPLYMNLFLGEVVVLDSTVILMTLIKVVLIPMILGDLTRRALIKSKGVAAYKSLKSVFGGISALGVVAIVFVAMAMKSKTILGNTALVWQVVLPLSIFYVGLLLISHLIGSRFLSEEDRIAMVYGVTLRNLTIALGISLSTFGQSMAVLLIALAYVVQLPVASGYMRYLEWSKTQALQSANNETG